MPSRARAITASALFECLAEIGAGGLERRNQTEDDAAPKRNHQVEYQDLLVDSDILPAWNVTNLVERDAAADEIEEPEGDQQTTDTAEQAQQQALGEHLPCEREAPCAQGCTDGNLSCS